MKTKILIPVLILSAFGFSQAPSIAWQKCLGTAASEEGVAIKPTADNGFIIGGTVVIPPAEGEQVGSEKFWIAKTDSQGETQWSGSYGSGLCSLSAICQTADGGYIAVGMTGDSDLPDYHGSRDGLAMKIGATGEMQWAKCFGGLSLDELSSVLQTPDGSYLVAGYSNSMGGDMPSNSGGKDGWIMKLDGNGDIQWSKNYGGFGDDYINQIIATTDGGFAFTGYSSSYLSGTWNIEHPNDAWLVKTATDGTVEWNTVFGESNYRERFDHFEQTSDGGFIAAGTVDGTEAGDILAVKFNNLGTIEWQRIVDGDNINMGYDVVETNNGYLICAITTTAPEEITQQYGIFDAELIKLAPDGEVQWTGTYAGGGNESFQDLEFMPDGSIIAIGYTSSTDGDITDVNHGSNDVWLVKFNPEALGNPNMVKTAFSVYPNPATSLLQLQLPEGIMVNHIVITDNLGRQVLKKSISDENIDIENLASGTYILQAFSGDKKFQTKFIKQ